MISYNNGIAASSQLWKLTGANEVSLDNTTAGTTLIYENNILDDGAGNIIYDQRDANANQLSLSVYNSSSDYSAFQLNAPGSGWSTSKNSTNENSNIDLAHYYVKIKTENNTTSDYNSLTVNQTNSSLFAHDGAAGLTREIALDNTAGIGLLINGSLSFGINPTGNLIIGNLDSPSVLTIQKKLIKVYDTGGLFVGYIEVKQ